MQDPFLGATGVRVSRLCMGTMTFGAEADEAESARLFDAAWGAGINHFDCADVYAGGRSEEILGRLIAGRRDEVVISSKVYFPTGPDRNARGLSRYHITRGVEASLRRLGTDCLDLLYLHRFDPMTSLEETIRAVDDLIRAGKVLYWGVSNFSAWQAMKALGVARAAGWAPPVCAQPMYNLVKRQAEVEILPMAASEGLAVFPYSPLGGGLLTGKYAGGARPEAGRITCRQMYGVRYGDPGYYATADAFSALAEELDVSPVSLAIAWVAAHPAVTAPIVGARNVAQLQPALDALSLEISDALYARIAALSPAPPPATDRNEESSAHNYGSR